MQARAAIAAGRVAVAGRIVRDPDHWLDPDRCELRLDGAIVERTSRVHLAMHKPAGVVTTRSDERGRPTVYDLLPAGLPFVSPVGRLDQDSSGLLLFTNDTQLAAAISGPASKLPKVYRVLLDASLSPRDVERLRAGAELDGERLLPIGLDPDRADAQRSVWTLREGKNRQIRRLAAACGRTVIDLHRVAIGPLQLGELAVGAVRPLRDDELSALRAAVRRRP